MKKINFNNDWVFHEGGGGALASLLGGEKTAKSVTLPHDASIIKDRNPDEPSGSGNGFFRQENYHYTKEFLLEESDADKNIWLEFEGVYACACIRSGKGEHAAACCGTVGQFAVVSQFIAAVHQHAGKILILPGSGPAVAEAQCTRAVCSPGKQKGLAA